MTRLKTTNGGFFTLRGEEEGPEVGDEGRDLRNIIYDAFVGLWRETRRPVRPEALAFYAKVSEERVYNYMRGLERDGAVVWEDGGWRPAE